jgi:tetratricopeptide (TPR) repeat protein
MNFLKNIFGSNKSKTSEENKLKAQQEDEEYETLKAQVDKINEEHASWEKEFSILRSLTEKARMLEKEGNLDEAENFYLQAIEFGEKNDKFGLNNYYYDINRLIIIYSKTKQTEKLRNFLEENIAKYSGSNDVKEWFVRLSKVDNQNTEIPQIQPEDITPQIPSQPTIGKTLNGFKKSMPEFNFYYDLPEGADTMTYDNKVPFEYNVKLREFRDTYDTIMSVAKIAENEGDYKKAIEAYEKLVVEEFEYPEPYERLMVIYSKLKWRNQEIEIINKAIEFFTYVRYKQKVHVLQLAEKYGMKEKASEYIDNDRKIFYYNGAYELYNPQVTRLNKWKERLEKFSNA